ncbi:S-formylglutathione hydrolase [Phyllobacterium endophyticum]|uniref:S-formylglutathione hydrolase n=1 Tax=Phyllobacterium endophyticum TaxID=1149773 RepID=A0A2P7B053_9HYPH|nr:S-formylglutathione hydrolase [Phyllobacterium endophyticum]MBB3235522.1 S-formylglutathione hydrolase [Phyllobacterium endophyticum]PSH59839.1 S-formylglutathione hydrolase [Phyllobacterium endophyticum]TYR41989.1 S-formylglutathione hydrolase [Phyllobacterium endophyticum]
METLSIAKSFEGTQGVYRHRSDACQCDMTFAVFLPPQARERPVPLLWYLSGLTCTHQNVMDKGEYRKAAAELGVAIICPDTSPRGDDIPDEKDNWQFGSGAGFYLDATEVPWSANYRMATYVGEELPELVAANFPVDMNRQSIFGHSMGGHGALTLALKNPGRFKSVSAFAPISRPMVAGWSRPAFEKYLGADEAAWRAYDSVALIEDGHRVPELLVDQGKADGFLDDGLRPWLLEEACEKAGIPLTLNMRDGYDHSYFFISTFMADHIKWHAERLS